MVSLPSSPRHALTGSCTPCSTGFRPHGQAFPGGSDSQTVSQHPSALPSRRGHRAAGEMHTDHGLALLERGKVVCAFTKERSENLGSGPDIAVLWVVGAGTELSAANVGFHWLPGSVRQASAGRSREKVAENTASGGKLVSPRAQQARPGRCHLRARFSCQQGRLVTPSASAQAQTLLNGVSRQEWSAFDI